MSWWHGCQCFVLNINLFHWFLLCMVLFWWGKDVGWQIKQMNIKRVNVLLWMYLHPKLITWPMAPCKRIDQECLQKKYLVRNSPSCSMRKNLLWYWSKVLLIWPIFRCWSSPMRPEQSWRIWRLAQWLCYFLLERGWGVPWRIWQHRWCCFWTRRWLQRCSYTLMSEFS